ncbi:MAG: HAMP domain-containing protein [Nitrospirae bacterium]|nr:HAMP domain-containing protein [Nitrospirota bacterium]
MKILRETLLHPNMFAKSLDRKILVVLSLCVAIVTAVIIYITNSRLSKGILEEFRADSRATMSVVAAGIKETMASGNSQHMEKQLLDIKAENRELDLFICSPDMRIIFSSDERSLRSKLDRQVLNSEIIGDLSSGLLGARMPDRVYDEEREGRKYYMQAHVIVNEPRCFRCHGSEKKVLGAVILRKSVEGKYAAIAELRDRNIVISLLGVLAIIAISHVLVTRLISKPIRALAREIAEFPDKIVDETIIGSAEITRDDEIGDLQKTFHNMAIDLYEKNHALQKSNADLANANRELESFAYSVSHDLRAPLRNIDGFSKILMDDYSDALPEKAKHYLRRVRNGTNRMSMLIDDILAFSKIGRAELNYRKISASAIVQGVLEQFSGEIEKRNVSIIVQALPEINCDQVLMQSLFSNLLSNALKYTRNTEHPEIVVGYDQYRKLIYVKDNGLGFDMQYRDKIFQIFQRLHLPEEYEGTGIGLSIVKRIAERHHGKVWAESEPGRGATFFIDMPTF